MLLVKQRARFGRVSGFTCIQYIKEILEIGEIKGAILVDVHT